MIRFWRVWISRESNSAISTNVLDANAVELAAATDGTTEAPLIYRTQAADSGEPMIVIAFDVETSNISQRVAFPILIANIANELAPSALPCVRRPWRTAWHPPAGGGRFDRGHQSRRRNHHAERGGRRRR